MQKEVLRRGCVNLGFPTEDILRNAAADHYYGWCCLGCRDGRKRGTDKTWLVDLAESKYGAILTDCEALKVITVKNGRKKCAAATGTSVPVQNRTPPLLRRSGLKNPNIGRNLHVHPVVMGWGHFPDSEKQSYEGGIMTGRMFKFSKTAHIFALARDKSCGEARSESEISYRIGKFDEENLRKGMERVVKEESGRRPGNESAPMCSAHQMGSCRMGGGGAHGGDVGGGGAVCGGFERVSDGAGGQSDGQGYGHSLLYGALGS
ncbi:hypothetical protein SASPL_131239 [Salvia splendens]|uniref:Glucose-methanol-choline oxidoreductase N-terminal domain-containing protein n=1 Tax=Salvia splendens TaxID=180675 RepID=A0A8X8X7E9_SALSN|nr:hypothetical protein SASPL_131239 [Salvia splendens]